MFLLLEKPLINSNVLTRVGLNSVSFYNQNTCYYLIIMFIIVVAQLMATSILLKLSKVFCLLSWGRLL